MNFLCFQSYKASISPEVLVVIVLPVSRRHPSAGLTSNLTAKAALIDQHT